MQIFGLDQFATETKDLGHLNEIHRDLLVYHLNLVWQIHPKLRLVPAYVFVESNLSQDLAAYVEVSVKSQLENPLLKFVQQYDSLGRLLPGVLTRHKANLVSYFKRVLDEKKLAIASQVSSVSEVLRAKMNNPHMFLLPNQDYAKKTVAEFICQLKEFSQIKKGSKVIFTGKKNNKADDMVMAAILSVAWARLPNNMYIAK